jgi:hypothetical protein
VNAKAACEGGLCVWGDGEVEDAEVGSRIESEIQIKIKTSTPVATNATRVAGRAKATVPT